LQLAAMKLMKMSSTLRNEIKQKQKKMKHVIKLLDAR